MKYISFIIIFFVASCGQQNKFGEEIKIMDDKLIDNLKLINKSKIFFGHQSVGANIIDGINDILEISKNINLNIVKINAQSKLPNYYFSHSFLGRNTDPISKCDNFSDILHREYAKDFEIALFKFCYVDFLAYSKPEEIFEYYKSTIDSIKAEIPELKIVHITVPLTTIQSGIVAWLKNLIGKDVGGYRENAVRFKFNEMLKNYYKNEPIFDLAAIESTYPDGKFETYEMKGNQFYALIPEYSYDGSHLNKTGRQLAAKELIKVLAETAN